MTDRDEEHRLTVRAAELGYPHVGYVEMAEGFEAIALTGEPGFRMIPPRQTGYGASKLDALRSLVSALTSD